MPFSILLFLMITGFTVTLALWAISSTLFADTGADALHRRTARITAASIVLMTLMAGVGPHIGVAKMTWAILPLPVLILIITWSNLVTLREAKSPTRLMAMPTTAYNMLLMGIYSTWVFIELFGLDLGVWGNAILAADAHTQTLCGHSTAVDSPTWLHLPIILPLTRVSTPERLPLVAPSGLLATALGLAFVMVMPHSFRHTQSYIDTHPAEVLRQPTIAIQMPWGDRVLAEKELSRLRRHLAVLGVRRVVFEVDTRTFADPRIGRQARKEIEWSRKNGIEATVITRAPEHFKSHPARTLNELRREMEQVQWQTVELLRPDILVLFTGPFAELEQLVVARIHPTSWLEAIRLTAKEIHQAGEETRFAVSLSSRDERAEQLFHALKRDDSPVQLVGLAIHAHDRWISELDADLDTLVRWCREGDHARPIMVTSGRCSPRIHGGERGQWHFVSRLLSFGAQAEIVEGITVGQLYDRRRDTGLVSWSGRRRMVYRELAASAQYSTPGR